MGNARELILSGTASVLETVGCRDDIMLYLISKGLDPKMSFKIMEKVRKGKVKKGGFDEGWEEAMMEHDVPDWYIESLAKIGYRFTSRWHSMPRFSPSGPRPLMRSTAAPVWTR